MNRAFYLSSWITISILLGWGSRLLVKINGALTFAPDRFIETRDWISICFEGIFVILVIRLSERRRLRRRDIRQKASERDETRKALMIGFERISTWQIRFRCPCAICTHLFIITLSFSVATIAKGRGSLWLRDSRVIGLPAADWPNDHPIILYVNKNGYDTAHFVRCTLVFVFCDIFR